MPSARSAGATNTCCWTSAAHGHGLGAMLPLPPGRSFRVPRAAGGRRCRSRTGTDRWRRIRTGQPLIVQARSAAQRRHGQKLRCEQGAHGDGQPHEFKLQCTFVYQPHRAQRACADAMIALAQAIGSVRFAQSTQTERQAIACALANAGAPLGPGAGGVRNCPRSPPCRRAAVAAAGPFTDRR